jgi:hypothetical protein
VCGGEEGVRHADEGELVLIPVHPCTCHENGPFINVQLPVGLKQLDRCRPDSRSPSPNIGRTPIVQDAFNLQTWVGSSTDAAQGQVFFTRS